MANLDDHLKLNNCPHCSVDFPNMERKQLLATSYDDGSEKKNYGIYVCKRCGGVVTAVAYAPSMEIDTIYPESEEPNEDLPDQAKYYMGQAMTTLAAPAASIVMSASSVDAMLKAKGYEEGVLYKRIEKAVEEHVLTKEMGDWAHDIRLDANDQRHADLAAVKPTFDDARRCIEFAKTLGDFLFVLPARVKRGIDQTAPEKLKKKSKLKNEPKSIAFPRMYSRNGYDELITIENSESKPNKAVCRFRQSASGNVLTIIEMGIEARPGSPKWWGARLNIDQVKLRPGQYFLEIVIDDHVQRIGTLNIADDAPRK